MSLTCHILLWKEWLMVWLLLSLGKILVPLGRYLWVCSPSHLGVMLGHVLEQTILCWFFKAEDIQRLNLPEWCCIVSSGPIWRMTVNILPPADLNGLDFWITHFILDSVYSPGHAPVFLGALGFGYPRVGSESWRDISIDTPREIRHEEKVERFAGRSRLTILWQLECACLLDWLDLYP